MLSPHYRVANEVESAGSIQHMWCSLCRWKYPFPESASLNHHFQEHHAICSSVYECHKPECRSGPEENWKFNYPSKFKAHMATCCPELKYKFETDVPDFIADAMADYVHLKHVKMFICLLDPGLPTLIAHVQEAPSTAGSEAAPGSCSGSTENDSVPPPAPKPKRSKKAKQPEMPTDPRDHRYNEDNATDEGEGFDIEELVGNPADDQQQGFEMLDGEPVEVSSNTATKES